MNKTNINTSRKGKWGKTGAPPKTVTFPHGKFTLVQIFEANPSICELTIRKRVEAHVKGYKMVKGVKVPVPKVILKLDEFATHDGVGRPNYLYRVRAGSLKALNAGAKSSRKGNKATVVPVVDVAAEVPLTPVEVPVVPATEHSVATAAETEPVTIDLGPLPESDVIESDVVPDFAVGVA
jgi:hypothetical protein